MDKYALSEWSTVLEQYTVISLWRKSECSQSYSKEICFSTTFTVSYGYIIRKDAKLLKERTEYCLPARKSLV